MVYSLLHTLPSREDALEPFPLCMRASLYRNYRDRPFTVLSTSIKLRFLFDEKHTLGVRRRLSTLTTTARVRNKIKRDRTPRGQRLAVFIDFPGVIVLRERHCRPGTPKRNVSRCLPDDHSLLLRVGKVITKANNFGNFLSRAR